VTDLDQKIDGENDLLRKRWRDGPDGRRRERQKTRLSWRSEIAIEPVERVLLDARERKDVTAVVQHVPLVGVSRAEQPEQRQLGGLNREKEVVAAVEHHHRRLDPWREVERVGLRQGPSQTIAAGVHKAEAARPQDRGAESPFDGERDR